MKTIILAGGSGTRLWPLSREKYPKQFINFFGRRTSLFQDTFKRSILISNVEDIYVVTNEIYKDLIIDQIQSLGYVYNEDNIVVEPEAKNTLAAIYAGVDKIVKTKEDDTIVVFPSDHLIKNNEEFATIIMNSKKLSEDYIVTFGIKPDKPNTGYGYISPGTSYLNGYKVNAFKEKPEYEKAKEYISNGYYWNSGIFMFSSVLFKNEVRKYSPVIFNAFMTSSNIKDSFSKINTKISIDYGLMEKSDRVAVVPVDIGWNDLGSFDSFYDVFESDENKNILGDQKMVIDSRNIIVHSRQDKIVSIIGVEDLIIIDESDALLVCKKSESQKVRNIVDELNRKSDVRIRYSTDYCKRSNQSILLEDKEGQYIVKKMTIKQDEQYTYELDSHKVEHWSIVRGIAKITSSSKVEILEAGEIFSLEGEKYSVENYGHTLLEIIEIQTSECS